MTMVNKERLRLWVAALRSGEYEQGQEALASLRGDLPPAYCCLGVACEVAIKNGLPLRRIENDELGKVRYDDAGGGLPFAAGEWFGFPSDPLIHSGDPYISAAPHFMAEPIRASVANDALLWSFAHIADAIEKYYGLNEGEVDGQ
jgi:hypothetical protein